MQNPAGCCPTCSKKMLAHSAEATLASVLSPLGWRQVQHTPLRCRNSRCERQGKLVWYNFLSSSEAALWHWPPSDQVMEYFFIRPSWGVTTSWLRQMSRRLVHHFASFRGEAAVHLAEAAERAASDIVPDKSHLKILKAWLLWRLVKPFDVVPQPMSEHNSCCLF